MLVGLVAEDPGENEDDRERDRGRLQNAAGPAWIVRAPRRAYEASREHGLERRLREDRGRLVDEVRACAEDRDHQKREEWIAALDKMESLKPRAVIAGHKRREQ